MLFVVNSVIELLEQSWTSLKTNAYLIYLVNHYYAFYLLFLSVDVYLQ